MFYGVTPDSEPVASKAIRKESFFECLEIGYDRRRRHSSLGMLTPIELEVLRSASKSEKDAFRVDQYTRVQEYYSGADRPGSY
ncbi:hypothetical protein [Streptosporangium sp. H16]|uniref:hypothetical protein n=1 Tax=Streptosporangium sp. H16 TaxID=3444184 RepID=UPI003F7AA49A